MKFIDYPNLLKCNGEILNKEKYKKLYEAMKELYMDDEMKNIRGPQEQEDNGFCGGSRGKDGGWGAKYIGK